MKLLSCYIENFGKLHAKSITFDEGITVIFRPNGYGKTTLCAFLRAMFYGLPSSRANSKTLEDRQKYCPFQGGAYGGNLLFVAGNTTYRVERFFDPKSETRDTLLVTANGSPVSVQNVGEEVLGLDEAAFVRTVFVGADQPTDSLGTTLSHLVEGTESDNDCEAALKKLDDERKRLKKSGSKGLIADFQQEAYVLQGKLRDLKLIEDGLESQYARRNALDQELTTLSAQENELRAAAVTEEKWATYRRYLQDADRAKGELETFDRSYPMGLPTKEERETLSHLATQYTKASQTDEENTRSSEQLSHFKERFAVGVPVETDLSAVRQDIERAERLKASLDAVSERQDGRAVELRRRFSRYSEEELSRLEEQAIGFRQQTTPVVKVTKNRGTLLLAIFAALVLIAGIVVAFFHTGVGIALLAVGAVTLIADGFFYLKGKMNTLSPSTQADGEKERFLASVGYSGEGGTTVALERFCADLRDYRSVLFSDRQTEGERSARRAEYDGLIARLNNYFLRFGLSDSPRNNYEQLKDEMTQYRRLLEERSSEEQTKRTREEQAQRCLSQADGICAKYRIQCGDLGDLVRKLEQAAYTRQMLCERLKEAQERAKAYYAAQNLQSPPASGNLAEVQAQINARKDEMRRLDAQIAEEERQTETIPTLKTALQEAKEKEEQARLRYGLLSDTFDAISAAKTRLKEEYITPVRKGFLSYAERLEQILGDRMEMDSELAVSFERNGVRRSEKHLSTGEHALCMLCLRLALADRLFRESPFLILDDPFVALDGEHLDRAKQLLRELAGTRQIVYFCCHESRTL